MNTQTITISAVDYDVKFGIKSNIILGQIWKIKHLSKIGEKLQKLNFKDGEEPTMPQMLVMAELVLSGILSKQPKAVIDADDVFEFILQNANEASKLMELYAKSLPQDNAGDKSKNVNPGQKK